MAAAKDWKVFVKFCHKTCTLPTRRTGADVYIQELYQILNRNNSVGHLQFILSNFNDQY